MSKARDKLREQYERFDETVDAVFDLLQDGAERSVPYIVRMMRMRGFEDSTVIKAACLELVADYKIVLKGNAKMQLTNSKNEPPGRKFVVVALTGPEREHIQKLAGPFVDSNEDGGDPATFFARSLRRYEQELQDNEYWLDRMRAGFEYYRHLEECEGCGSMGPKMRCEKGGTLQRKYEKLCYGGMVLS